MKLVRYIGQEHNKISKGKKNTINNTTHIFYAFHNIHFKHFTTVQFLVQFQLQILTKHYVYVLSNIKVLSL